MKERTTCAGKMIMILLHTQCHLTCPVHSAPIQHPKEASQKNANEERLWSEINWEFMSEESEVDDESLNRHPLAFRSDTISKSFTLASLYAGV